VIANDATKADAEEAAYAAAIAEALSDAARVLVPMARMYLGPAVAVVLRDQPGHTTGDLGEVDRQILMLAFNKLVIEAGALPAPGKPYEPHTTTFSIDATTRMGNALDLGYVLAALRGLTAWAGAGPTTTAAAALTAASADTTATASSMAMNSTWTPPASARDLRMAARARGYAPASAVVVTGSATAVSPARTPVGRSGGCGCRAGTPVSSRPSTRRPVSRRPSREPDCRDPKPRCDCGGTCGGRGCGCSGTASCTDCIPRGVPANEHCTCGTCPPRPPEACTPWTPSCETRNRLRVCLKDILCELLLCIEQALCKDGRLDPNALRQWRQHLIKCFADLFCRLLRCIREALCPPPVDCKPALPPVNDCIPCSYAVEDPR
jgi:hypothetical protein